MQDINSSKYFAKKTRFGQIIQSLTNEQYRRVREWELDDHRALDGDFVFIAPFTPRPSFSIDQTTYGQADACPTYCLPKLETNEMKLARFNQFAQSPEGVAAKTKLGWLFTPPLNSEHADRKIQERISLQNKHNEINLTID